MIIPILFKIIPFVGPISILEVNLNLILLHRKYGNSLLMAQRYNFKTSSFLLNTFSIYESCLHQGISKLFKTKQAWGEHLWVQHELKPSDCQYKPKCCYCDQRFPRLAKKREHENSNLAQKGQHRHRMY